MTAPRNWAEASHASGTFNRPCETNVAAAAITLSPEQLTRLDLALPPGAAAGERYSVEGMKGLNA